MGFFDSEPVQPQLPPFAIIDFETAGLDERVNPPLSIAVVIADSEMNELDGFACKILPPKGTVLGVPSPEDQPNVSYSTRDAWYMDVYTGEKMDKDRRDAEVRPYISCSAAAVNGFVQSNADGSWNLNSINAWLRSSRSPEAVALTIRRLFAQHFSPQSYERAGDPLDQMPSLPRVQAVAHNAAFDRKFARQHFPAVETLLLPRWICTANWYKRAMNIKKGYKLSDVCEKIGRQQQAAHEALSDCRDCLAALRWLKQNHLKDLSLVG